MEHVEEELNAPREFSTSTTTLPVDHQVIRGVFFFFNSKLEKQLSTLPVITIASARNKIQMDQILYETTGDVSKSSNVQSRPKPVRTEAREELKSLGGAPSGEAHTPRTHTALHGFPLLLRSLPATPTPLAVRNDTMPCRCRGRRRRGR